MKKVYLGFIFCISISAGAQTSVYHPFPDSNALWNINVICYNGSCAEWFNYKYEYGVDTIVGAYSYKQVTGNMINHSNGPICFCPTEEGGGYLRQDTSARKVFWVQQSNFANEFLLYDFNLNVGDTMTGIPAQWCTLIVSSIDSILIGSSYRKKINFNNDPCNRFSIIEGIGGTHGLTNNICFAMGYEAVLICFSENDITVYNTLCAPNHAIACDSILSNDNFSFVEYTFTLSPNPATNQLTIQVARGRISPAAERQEAIKEIEIYDVLGQKRLTLNLRQLTEEGLSVSINVSELAPGIYFVRVRGEKIFAVRKFVKE